MKKIVRLTGGLLGLMLVGLTGGIWGARQAEGHWLLLRIDFAQGDQLAWVDITTGKMISMSPRMPSIEKVVMDSGWLYLISWNDDLNNPRYDLYRMDWRGGQFRHLAELLFLTEFYLSPDGKRIAYCDRDSNFRVAGSDGSGSRYIAPCTPLYYMDATPFVFAPDGPQAMVAAADSSNNLDIYRVAVETPTTENLTTTIDGFVTPIVWLPDEWLLVKMRDGATEKVLRMRPDGSELTALTTATLEAFVRWLTDDGLIILFNYQNRRLTAVRTNDWATAWERPGEYPLLTPAMPYWSLGIENGEWQATRVDGSETLSIPIPDGMTDLWDVWGEAPDGESFWVMYSNHESGQVGLWRLHLPNHTLEQIWGAGAGDPHFIGWIADGQRVLWSNTVYDSLTGLPITAIYSIGRDGRELTTITQQQGEVLQVMRHSEAGRYDPTPSAGILGGGILMMSISFIPRRLFKRKRPAP